MIERSFLEVLFFISFKSVDSDHHSENFSSVVFFFREIEVPAPWQIIDSFVADSFPHYLVMKLKPTTHSPSARENN